MKKREVLNEHKINIGNSWRSSSRWVYSYNYPIRIYKREVDKSIEYENFRKDVLIKAAKERRELREALAKQQELKEKMAELSKKREEARKTNGTE